MSNIVKLCADCMLSEGHSLDESEFLHEICTCFACGKRIGTKTPFQAYLIWKSGVSDGTSVEISPDDD